MSPTPSEPAMDLARQIRAELSEPAPQGFQFVEHVMRQDAGLELLSRRLAAHSDRAEVEDALSHALRIEQSGWVLLKLIELADRLQPSAAAAALLGLAEHPPGEGERSTFLAGRACEVLLKLPLDVKARAEANRICGPPLQSIHQFRLGAERERLLQRPKRLEWILLAALMALGVGGFVYVLLSTRGP